MGKVQDWDFNDFYCTRCGQKGINVIRAKRKREAGHLKKLYCLNCQRETNHVECKGKYTHNDFLEEFYAHNFDVYGLRKLSLSDFHTYMNERKQVDNGWEWRGKIYDNKLNEVK